MGSPKYWTTKTNVKGEEYGAVRFHISRKPVSRKLPDGKKPCKCFQYTGYRHVSCRGYIDNENRIHCSLCHALITEIEAANEGGVHYPEVQISKLPFMTSPGSGGLGRRRY